MGFDTTVLTRGAYLRSFDQEMANLVVRHMEEDNGMRFLKRAIIQSIEKQENNKLLVKWKDENGSIQQVKKTKKKKFHVFIFSLFYFPCLKGYI